jgi:hypothetical protein
LQLLLKERIENVAGPVKRKKKRKIFMLYKKERREKEIG